MVYWHLHVRTFGLFWKRHYAVRIFAGHMTFDRDRLWWLHGALCIQGLRWKTPAEFTAPVTCNHVIATCHSAVHCVLLDISIKFYCKSVFKRPNLGIKTERYDGEASVFFSVARQYEAPIRCLVGLFSVFPIFNHPERTRRAVAQGRRSSSCCCCCLLRPQCCACGTRPCVSLRCLLAKVMCGDQCGRAGRWDVKDNSLTNQLLLLGLIPGRLKGNRNLLNHTIELLFFFYLCNKLIFPLKNKAVHVSDNNNVLLYLFHFSFS